MEYRQLVRSYSLTPQYSIIPNGIDENLFNRECSIEKDDHMVLSVARIEGLKNQFNLIKAINNSQVPTLYYWKRRHQPSILL